MATYDPYLGPLVQQLITPGEYDQLTSLNSGPSAAPTAGPSLVNQMAYESAPASGMAMHGPATPPGFGANKLGQFLINKAKVPPRFIGPAYRPGAIGSVAGYFAAPMLGSLAEQLTGIDKSKATSVIQGASTGAGIGSMVGPWGTAAGGLIGGALSAFKGDDKPPEMSDEAGKLLSAYGVDETTQGAIMGTYERLKEADKDTADSWLASVAQQAQAKFLEDSDPFKEQTQMADLQLQQLAGQAMSPYVQNMTNNLDAASTVLNEGMKNFNPQQRAMMKPLISQYVHMSDNVAQAYALQTMSFPQMNKLTESSWANMQAQQSGGASGLTDALTQQLATSGQ